MTNLRLIARLDIKGPNLIKGVHLEGCSGCGLLRRRLTKPFEHVATEPPLQGERRAVRQVAGVRKLLGERGLVRRQVAGQREVGRVVPVGLLPPAERQRQHAGRAQRAVRGHGAG